MKTLQKILTRNLTVVNQETTKCYCAYINQYQMACPRMMKFIDNLNHIRNLDTTGRIRSVEKYYQDYFKIEVIKKKSIEFF